MSRTSRRLAFAAAQLGVGGEARDAERAALEAALPMLRTQLADSGIQLGQSNISSESFAGQQQSSGQQQQAGRAQGQDIFAAEDDAILATPASLQAAARGDGAVDIFA